MKIPDSVVYSIHNEVQELLKEPYDKYILDGTDFDVFSKEVLNKVLDSLQHLVEVNYDTLYPVINKRYNTKKRWMNGELNSEGSFHKEVEIIARGVYEQFRHQPEKFQLLYSCKSPDDLREKRLEELNEWCRADQTPVCHFLYLDGKQVFQIKKAMQNDIEYIALNIIREECPLGMQSAIVALPHSISNIPIDFSNRVKMEEKDIVDRGQDKFFANTYYIDDETFLESLLNVEVLKTGVLNSVLKTLNFTDIDVFLQVMSLRDENFYATREIIVDIGTLVRKVFSTTGSKNYMAVKESLYRMAHLTAVAVDAGLRGFTVRLFENVSIYKSSVDKDTARIVVNLDIVNEYIKNQTINMYKETIDKFSMNSSKVAIFPLQRERIRCSTTTKEGEPLLFQTNINFFRGILYFSNKRKRENIKLIEKILDEIVDNKITVKGYERKGDTFILEFYPISNRERRDLLNQKELPYQQLPLAIT